MLFRTRRHEGHEGFLGGIARFYLTQSAEVVLWVAPAAGRGSNVAGQSLLLRPRSGLQPWEQKRCSVVSCGGAKLEGECPHEPSSATRKDGRDERRSSAGKQTLAPPSASQDDDKSRSTVAGQRVKMFFMVRNRALRILWPWHTDSYQCTVLILTVGWRRHRRRHRQLNS